MRLPVERHLLGDRARDARALQEPLVIALHRGPRRQIDGTEAATDAAVREKLGGGLRELTGRFETRLRAAREQGELPADADPALLAELAGAVLHSIALRARAGDSRRALQRFARAAVATLCGGGPGARRRRARR